MNTIELRLGKVQAKYFRWHQEGTMNKSEVSPLFREMLLLLIEPKYDFKTKKYKKELYKEEYTERIMIQITEIDNTLGVRDQSVMHIPAFKMVWLNKFIMKMIRHEINMNVNAYLLAGKQVREAILSIYDLYDIEEAELNYDSMLKQNIRYRHR